MALFASNPEMFDGLPVSDPQAFPNPVIRPCNRMQIPIRTEDNRLEMKVGLVCSVTNHMYVFGEQIRTAIFGRVVFAILLQQIPETNEFRMTTYEVAIKVYVRERLRALQGRTQENPLMEITALQFLGDHHPCILGQIECVMDTENIYSIMRYYGGGELFDNMSGNGPMDDNQARHFFRLLISAMQRFQELGIAHRDMSLENILCGSEEGTYAIIDFGMCLRLTPHPETQPGHPAVFLPICKQVICGKRNYIAPEVLREDPYFHPMLTDIWAVGIILFMVLTGVPPVDMANENDDRYSLICDNGLQEMVSAWGYDINPLAVDLIQRILRPNPRERLTIERIMAHPWMQIAD